MMLDRGEQLDWFSSREIIAEAVVSGLGLYLFVVHLLTADHPFIDRRLFRDRNLVVGLAFIFVVGIILLATLALLTPFLQTLLDWPVMTAGLVMAPRYLAAQANQFNEALTSGAAALNAEMTRQATLVAFLDDFRLMMALARATIPLVIFMRRPGRAAHAPAPAME